MYLKRLDVQGFKSFANKTTVDFATGVTCIVGPNGCGKTNVADSLRWVLGEHASRTLRARKTEDVIFAGSEKRAPMVPSFAFHASTWKTGGFAFSTNAIFFPSSESATEELMAAPVL